MSAATQHRRRIRFALPRRHPRLALPRRHLRLALPRRRIRSLAVPALAALALACPGLVAPALAQSAPETWSPDISTVDGDDTNVVATRAGLSLADSQPRESSARMSRAQGILVLRPHQLSRSADRITAALGADLPPGSSALVDARAQRADGNWTQWTEVRTGSPALLAEPSTLVQARLVLVAGDGGVSPLVRTVTLTADRAPDRPLDPGRDAVAPQPLSYPVFATREGLVGGTTANGHKIKERDHFVALPSRRGLSARGGDEYSVKVCAPNGRCAWAPVWDVGPWNITDDYWNPPETRQSWRDLPHGRPEADAAFRDGYNGGRDGFGRRVRNPAGIDLADGTFWDALQLRDNSWVTVTYLWTGQAARTGTVRTDGPPLHVRGSTDPSTADAGLAGNSSRVPIECEARGAIATGTQGTSDVWLRIGPNQFVSKAWVETLPAPPC